MVQVTPLRVSAAGLVGVDARCVLDQAHAAVAASDGELRVTVVGIGDPSSDEDGGGVAVRRIAPSVISATGHLSWDVLDAIRGADLVHVHDGFSRGGELTSLAALCLGRPVAVTPWGGQATSVSRPEDLVDAVDRQLVASAYEAGRAPSGAPVSVVAFGVDTTRFSPAPAVARRRDRAVLVGDAGRSSVTALLEVFPGGVGLTVVRSSPDEPPQSASGEQMEWVDAADVDALAATLGQALAVVAVPEYVSAVPGLHASPDRSPVAVVEAMACGVPAVVSAVGALPEVVDDEVNGFVVDGPAQLGWRLTQLAGDEGLVRRLGGAARRSVEGDHGAAASGERLLAAYRAILEA